ncbi:hypothetical protein MPSEU_000144100 [Mayamaea pseudoterrestris]|nr:hypothetical protein MPSEU_000144100 [Mayamaea pseudoterrestris]
MLPLSARHTKGLLTLILVILTETVSVSEAVSAWKKNKLFHKKPHRQQQSLQQNCPSTTSSPHFSKARAILLASSVSQPYWREAPSKCDCCSSCVDKIPRGGHSHAQSLVSAKQPPYGIPLHLWKVIFQALLTAINVFFWLVPLKSRKMTENKVALGLANAFSGGVFLSLAFGHLIPECVHGLDKNVFPEVTPYLLVLAGYLLIFFVEKVAFDAHGALHELEHGGSKHGHAHPVANGSRKPGAVIGNSNHQRTPSEVARAESTSGRSAVILLGALAVHSVLEMMALGLADSFEDCALLTLSIALHQPAESIALLVAFLKSGMKESEIMQYLSIFSCMGPIGVGLGMAVNEFAAPAVDSIMLALVAGTFIYVGATEVIPEEWEDQEHKWKKFAALISGIASILAITSSLGMLS